MDKKLSSDESRDIVKRVFADNWPLYKKQFFFAALMLITIACVLPILALAMDPIAGEVFTENDIQLGYILGFTVFFVFTVRGFATLGHMYILGKVSNNIVARYQRRVFDHLLKLGVEYHKSTRSSYIVGLINQHIMNMRNMLNEVLIVFAKDLLSVIFLVSVMIYQDPLMSFLTLLVLPVIAMIIRSYTKRIKNIAKQEVSLNARVTSGLIENSQGMEILKAFTMESQMLQKMHDLTVRAEAQSNHIVRLNAKTKPATDILAGFAIGAVIAFGGYQVAAEGHDPGKLVSFLTAALLAYEPARRLSTFRVTFEKACVHASMLYELLDIPPRQADKPNAKELKLTKGAIEISDLHFAYNKNEPIIEGISLTAVAGKTTALVGPSGGGKSTLISLIQRFFDVKKGKILIDGQNIKNVTAQSLRKNIAYVSQQPILFEGSILENIRYGKPDASDDDIFEAAKLAQAHEFILEQLEGYDTLVGEMGANLSGGQRQRLSIARAFLRDAPILLLDEATSALDNESELLVQQALDSLMKGRTTIVVAHRLSTIRNASRIYVIEDGKVTQNGTHAALMKKKTGTYARLHGIGNNDLETILNPSIKVPDNGRIA